MMSKHLVDATDLLAAPIGKQAEDSNVERMPASNAGVHLPRSRVFDPTTRLCTAFATEADASVADL